MSKWFKFSIAGMLLVGALAALITGMAFAQEETPTTPTTPQSGIYGLGEFRDATRQAGAEAAAAALGMSVEEMNAQLWGGRTLADLADQQGVDIADVQAAVQAAVQTAREASLRTAIETALSEGTITQEHADWLLEGLDKGFLGDGAFGVIFGGRGGFGGPMGGGRHGGFMVPPTGGLDQAPSEIPSLAPSTAPTTGG